MKIRNALAAVIIAGFTSSAANAAVVDFGNPVTGGGENIGDIGTVSSNQSGTFFTTPNTGFGLITGSLANNSEITFTYTFSNSSPFQILASSGGISDSANFASANSGGFSIATGGAFASANLSGLNGTTSISNVSGSTLSFSSIFVGLLNLVTNGQGGFVGKINYSVSAVPLPSTVLMFGAALAGMFAFSRKQRKVVSSLA